MEYVDIGIGIPANVGHITALGNAVAPSVKPVYKSSVFETENIQDFYVELEIGSGLTRVATSNGVNADHTVQGCQITVWTKMGSEYKQFTVSPGGLFNTTYIINVGANASGSSTLKKADLLQSSSITPYIGSRTYITVEPAISTSAINPVTAWDWINGTNQIPAGDIGFGSGVGYEGYVEVKLIKAFLVGNKYNN